MTVHTFSDAFAYLCRFRAVIFDLDDTLYSETSYIKSGYRKIARHVPQIRDMERKLWTAFQAGLQAIDAVLTEEGLYSPELAAECLAIYREQDPEIALYEGVLETLCSLRERGIGIGMITDGRPLGQRAKIKALRLEPYFDHIIVTDELGGAEFRKPNPTAFVMMRDFFGCPYGEMVYLGDNPRKDFAAPRELGMKTVYFKNADGIYSGTEQDQ